ncbi:Sensor histidine kinase PhoQ [hydrothermal vent metagenome]|uniref:histidine kinase n=1 Tax=hydrothermal vent metagenome TaxID=652676 RepID=A0A3B0Y4T7_9ZZZZ
MSLNLRIILSASLVLAIFITLTAAALNRAFVESTESALRDKLTSQLYALLAAAEVSENEILMPSSELNALLGLPSSGVYAYIINQNGKALWQSSSVLGTRLPPPRMLQSGHRHFRKDTVDGQNFYTFAYGINWINDDSTRIALTFNITTDLKSFNRQINEYRTTLWSWLLAMAVLLLMTQAAILRWGLLPLRRVGAELNQIESGRQQQVEGSYPQEISHLTDNINLLLQQEREQKTRYRNALGDLAHSLKTPLAVLQSGLNTRGNNNNSPPDQSMQEQITRMNSIVEYQLQRAATAGASSSAQSLEIKPVIDRILASLEKVYRDSSITPHVSVEDALTFRGDEGDLMELLGNLLDNAYKWARQNVYIIAERKEKKLSLKICDDGPGIPAEHVKTLLQRGARADQTIAGHGIGLSIVRNIVDAWQGELIIRKSPQGGAEIQIIL